MPKKRAWRNMGVATQVDITGNTIPVRVRRPTLRILKERGADIKVRNVKGGYKGIFVGAQGARNSPSLPSVDFGGYGRRVNELVFQNRKKSKLFAGGRVKYAGFIQEGKYRSTPSDSAVHEEPTKTTASFRGKRVVPVMGGGEVGWKPWHENFFLFHPIKTATNVFRWMRNPSTRKAEQREFAAAEHAAGQAGVNAGIKKLHNQYRGRLRKALIDLKQSHNNLSRAYILMGRGRITPERFMVQRGSFLLRQKRFEELLNETGKAEREYEQGRQAIAAKLAKERGKVI